MAGQFCCLAVLARVTAVAAIVDACGAAGGAGWPSGMLPVASAPCVAGIRGGPGADHAAARPRAPVRTWMGRRSGGHGGLVAAAEPVATRKR